MMSDDIPVVGVIVYFHIYIVSNTSHLPLVSMDMCTCSRWINCSLQACIVTT